METLRISLKDLKQKRDQKNYLKSRLQTKEKDFKRFLNDHSLVDRKRKYTESLKALVKEGLDSSDKLLRAIKEGMNIEP